MNLYKADINSMREILFRWLNADGDFVYGSLIYGIHSPIIHIGEHEWVHVYPNNIEQLIGRDMFGRRVFEGDTVITDGFIHKASFDDYKDLREGKAFKHE